MATTQASSCARPALKRPSERAVAFAMSIVDSKPEGLTVRDYIHLLRQHVAKGRRKDAVSTGYHHLDRSSFWHAEHDRVKGALQTAEAKAVDLRREIDALKAKLESAKTAVPPPPSKKRRKVDEDVILVPRSPKRARKNASPTRGGSEHVMIDLDRNFDFTHTGEIGNMLMRSLYQMHAILKRYKRTDSAALAHHLLRAASALPQVLQRLLELHAGRSNSAPDSLRSSFAAAARTVASLIVGVNRLGQVSDGVEVRGHVIYAYVCMFLKFLETFEAASAREIDGASAEASSSGPKSASSTKAKSTSKQPKTTSLKDVPSLNAIINLLCGVIDLLDPSKSFHRELFEGFTYCTYSKLGARLYVSVFGHARGATLADEIAISARSEEIKDTTSLLSEEPHIVRQAKLEAPYLVHLLQHIMKAAPGHLGAAISAKTGRAKQANNQGSMKGTLTNVAKERLQRTLVACMFGTEGVEEGDALLDGLKRPVVPAKNLPLPKVKEVEVSEWFKEEVWRLLGWEILAKEVK